jgi:carboxyl-terminal processing protease
MFSFARAAATAIVAVLAAPQTGRATAASLRDPVQTATAIPADTGVRARLLDSAFAVATFDSAWRTVGSGLEGRGVTRLDWRAVGRELRPRAARAASDSALRVVIGEMLSRIGESHFAVISGRGTAAAPDAPADESSLGTAGLALRFLDRRLVIWRVDSGGPARAAGVVPGWIVEQIDDLVVPALGVTDTLPLQRLPVLTDAMRALHGAPGMPVRVIARDADGVRHDVTFQRAAIRGPLARFGNLPPLPTSFEATRRTLADGRCIAIIHFEYWLPPVMPPLDRAVDANRGCAGMVLDLRGNLGGVAAMMMGVSGHFLNEPSTLGTMRTRGEEMRFVANPRRSTSAGLTVVPFAGPLAIIVDGLSASTSEMFGAAFQALGRARVFGERTAGQALPAMATRLPNGDVLMHVVADFVAADGSQIEGKGVIPDELVPLRPADLARGRDAPLEAAVRWISTRRTAP